MKKILLSSLMAAAAAVPALAGVDNINYQAVIKDGSSVVANKAVELKFELLDTADKVVYTEDQKVETNAAGYVSCQLGTEELSTIEWGDLTLRVSINLGNGFEVISNEEVSSVPTALYALRSADSDMIKEAVEELMIDNEAAKERFNGISAEIVQFQSFMEDVDGFNTELVEKLEPMMGLNYEEINDFHERVSEALINLQNSTEELNTYTEAFAEMLEVRLDKMQNQMDEADKTAEENYDDLKGSIMRNEQNIAALQGKQNEDIEALNRDIEAAFDRNQAVMDKIQNQADATDKDLENIKENLTKAFEAKDAEIAEINGQLENLNNVAAVVRVNEEAIEALQGDFKNLGENLDNLVTEMNAKFEEVNGQLENLNNVSAVVRANEEAIEELQGDFKNIGENLDNLATEMTANFGEVNSQLENLKNFVDVVKEEYATNESVEDAFYRLQTILDKMQRQIDSLEAGSNN